MPTATKIVSAVAFALVGLWAAISYIPQLPEGTSVGHFPELMTALGFVLGWRSVGRFTGRGYGESLGLGLRGSFLLVFWALLGFASYTMLMRSTKQVYRGDPGRALMDVPQIMLQYAELLWARDVLVALVVGGLLGGLVAEFAARRWT
ncbi:TrgA family protein [bacterium]|nr:TrgA family protein [bacterium]